MIIALCGSIKFREEFEKEAARLTEEGHVILMPCVWEHFPDYTPYERGYKRKENLQNIHNVKIDIAEAIHVINKDGYVGRSTQIEIMRAQLTGKGITFMERYGNGEVL